MPGSGESKDSILIAIKSSQKNARFSPARLPAMRHLPHTVQATPAFRALHGINRCRQPGIVVLVHAGVSQTSRIEDGNPPSPFSAGTVPLLHLEVHFPHSSLAFRYLIQLPDLFLGKEEACQKGTQGLLHGLTATMVSVDTHLDTGGVIRIAVDIELHLIVHPEGHIRHVPHRSFRAYRSGDLLQLPHSVVGTKVIRNRPPWRQVTLPMGIGKIGPCIRFIAYAEYPLFRDRPLLEILLERDAVCGGADDQSLQHRAITKNNAVWCEVFTLVCRRHAGDRNEGNGQKGNEIRNPATHFSAIMVFISGNRILQAFWTFLFGAMLAGCVTPPASRPPVPKVAQTAAPSTGKFWWGISTSSYQNEDRGVSPDSPEYFLTDWDIFAQEGLCPPRGEDAAFSWTHFRKDIKALQALGVTHYRFSIEWARVEPRRGEFNHAALRRYATMARELKAAGIEPVVTLWHFTFPSWAYDPKQKDRSNFLHPDIRPAWDRYVQMCVTALKPSVHIWVPQNEPNGALPLGYLGGYWPPGLTLRPGLYKKAMHVSTEMFRDAAAIIRSQQKNALIMGAYSVPKWRRKFFQDPTAVMYNLMLRTNTDHLDRVYDVCDFIGVNYYYTQDANIFGLLKDSQGEISSTYTQLGWTIRPQGMYESLTDIWKRYKMPIIVTENGLGTLSEQKKIRYFREHISQMRRAMAKGVDVRGYFAWTLVDNYEWQEGWTANFGLTHFDPVTKERIIEPSGIWYREFIRKHRRP